MPSPPKNTCNQSPETDIFRIFDFYRICHKWFVRTDGVKIVVNVAPYFTRKSYRVDHQSLTDSERCRRLEASTTCTWHEATDNVQVRTICSHSRVEYTPCSATSKETITWHWNRHCIDVIPAIIHASYCMLFKPNQDAMMMPLTSWSCGSYLDFQWLNLETNNCVLPIGPQPDFKLTWLRWYHDLVSLHRNEWNCATK